MKVRLLSKRTPRSTTDFTFSRGNNKRRLDAEDIYGLWEFLGKEKNKVPDYVARNLQRIPAIHPSDTDVVRLATTVCDLKKQLEDLRTVVSGIMTKDSPPEQSTISHVDVGSGENVEIGSDRSDGDAQVHTKLLYSELPVFRTKGDDGSYEREIVLVRKDIFFSGL